MLMSVTTAELVSDTRRLSQLSRSQLAAMAGLSATTIYRIETGQVDPTTETVDRILAAAGYRQRKEVVPVSDPSAVAAARGVIDPASGLLTAPGARVWADRWKAAGFVTEGTEGQTTDKPALLAWRAGIAARLAYRPGIVRLRREGGWIDIARKVASTGQRWAATGGVAANRLVSSADAPWPVFYVEDPGEVVAQAGFTAKGREAGPSMSLIPFDGVADVGIETDAAGLNWAAPLQVLIDCYGGTDRMPEQADAVAAALGYGSPDA
jgi:transcriptional regulator with XRE-family HTH domain